MAHSYPIWHKVEACIYNSNKSYGAKDTSEDVILVGSSASNSHTLGKVVTTKRIKEVDGKSLVVFMMPTK